METSPSALYRTSGEGYVFEIAQEALEQSVSDAGDKLFSLLKEPEKLHSKGGSSLIADEIEIRNAVANLFKAFAGNSFTKYKKVK